MLLSLQGHSMGRIVLTLGQLFLAINILALLWRVGLFLRYRPCESCADDELPRCSVVVPAYNEGRQVLETLRSLAASDYPADRLSIVAVDDGSVDDTWQWIRLAAEELPALVTPVRLPTNRGKRQALHEGFKQSSGDVLVTVDSDSTVEAQTLRRLVSPFVRNPQVGAVAGNVRVLNRRAGIIPKMLDVVFLFSFDFIRAGQSVVNAVMCTPGALSAYRRDILSRVLDEWLRQTFCGRPAAIGEDRAMTNLILREGYHVVFQQDAMVYTTVPTRYRNLCRMFLRWARSNVRETIVMSTFVFRRFRKGSMIGARINLLLQWMGLTKSQMALLLTAACLAVHPAIIGINCLFSIALASNLIAGLYAWRCRSSDALWGYAYGLFWCVALTWITPYALLTPHRSAWLTRQKRPVPQTCWLRRLPKSRFPEKLRLGLHA